MKHRVSFRPVPEEKALEQDDLDDSAERKCRMNANAYSNLSTFDGGWEHELGEDDP